MKKEFFIATAKRWKSAIRTVSVRRFLSHAESFTEMMEQTAEYGELEPNELAFLYGAAMAAMASLGMAFEVELDKDTEDALSEAGEAAVWLQEMIENLP